MAKYPDWRDRRRQAEIDALPIEEVRRRVEESNAKAEAERARRPIREDWNARDEQEDREIKEAVSSFRARNYPGDDPAGPGPETIREEALDAVRAKLMDLAERLEQEARDHQKRAEEYRARAENEDSLYVRYAQEAGVLMNFLQSGQTAIDETRKA